MIVCSRCGGKLVLRLIWDEDFTRPICEVCETIDYGVPENVFKIVNTYVREHHYHYYWDELANKDAAMEEYYIKSNVSHLSNIFVNLKNEYQSLV